MKHDSKSALTRTQIQEYSIKVDRPRSCARESPTFFLTGSMSKPHPKKSSIKVRVARSPTLLDKTPVIRAICFHRTRTGRIGATTSTTTHAEEERMQDTGSPTPTPSAAETQTNHSARDLPPEIGSSPEQLEETHAVKRPPVSSTSTKACVALTILFQYRPIQDWLPHRQSYLDELLRHDGRKADISQCCSAFSCTNSSSFICRDCMHSNSYCQSCLLERHQNLPFHRIMVTSSTLHRPIRFH